MWKEAVMTYFAVSSCNFRGGNYRKFSQNFRSQDRGQDPLSPDCEGGVGLNICRHYFVHILCALSILDKFGGFVLKWSTTTSCHVIHLSTEHREIKAEPTKF
jgi:hypothetical protein